MHTYTHTKDIKPMTLRSLEKYLTSKPLNWHSISDTENTSWHSAQNYWRVLYWEETTYWYYLIRSNTQKWYQSMMETNFRSKTVLFIERVYSELTEKQRIDQMSTVTHIQPHVKTQVAFSVVDCHFFSVAILLTSHQCPSLFCT